MGQGSAKSQFQGFLRHKSFGRAITTLAWCLSIIEGYQGKIEVMVIELNAIYPPSITESTGLVLWC
jgi:hypothetical protein